MALGGDGELKDARAAVDALRGRSRGGRHFHSEDRRGVAAQLASDEGEPGDVSLTDEERDMRNAGRRLANEGDTSLQETMARLIEVIERQNVMLMQLTELRSDFGDVLHQLHEVADDLHKTKEEEVTEDHVATQAVIMGVRKVQEDAQETAIKGIRNATEESRKSIKRVKEETETYIKSLTEQSKARIERLARVTLPDRLFEVLKWSVMTLLLVILVHVVWQMFV